MRSTKTYACYLTGLCLLSACVSTAALEHATPPPNVVQQVDVDAVGQEIRQREGPGERERGELSPCAEACARIAQIGEHAAGHGTPEGYEQECRTLCNTYATAAQLQCLQRAKDYEDLGACATN